MRTSPMLRLGIMGLLMFMLLVPLAMIYSVVSERETRRNAVTGEISAEAGGAQTVGGPVLVIPYRYTSVDNQGRSRSLMAYMSVLPDLLRIDGQVEPEIRRRALFPVIVYRAHLKISGRVSRPDLSHVRPAPEEVLWDDAMLSVGVSDPKGISRRLEANIGGQTRPFVPGVSDVGLFSTGVQAPAAGPLTADSQGVTFSLELDLNGTRELRFLPAGHETTVQLSSTWPHPSFVGAPLADERRVDRDGFSATWRVPYFGRGYPPIWTSASQNREQLMAQAAASAFGVTLVQPVDIYLQTERAVKYAVLFIVLTFVIAFLWEITGGVLLHPVQYVFLGFTMCVFYLLLLSLSEHTGFDAAYLIASAATVTLLSKYWSWVLRAAKGAWLMGAALSLLYGYLYLLLRLEDYALLAGSIGVFLALAIVMFLTRQVNWYELRLGATGL
jgi:inner membrane protein